MSIARSFSQFYENEQEDPNPVCNTRADGAGYFLVRNAQLLLFLGFA